MLSVIIFFATTIIANAGELDRILSKSPVTVLYLYSQTCTYCQKFDPVYTKLSNKYGKQCQFRKIDVKSKEGYNIMSEMGVRYLPYVMIFNARKQTVAPLETTCMLTYSCSEAAIKKQLK